MMTMVGGKTEIIPMPKPWMMTVAAPPAEPACVMDLTGVYA